MDIKQLFLYKDVKEKKPYILETENTISYKPPEIDSIYKDINQNLEFIKELYQSEINGDFKIREFKIRVNNKYIEAFMILFDGMIDRNLVNESILKPLMTLSGLGIAKERTTVREYIDKHLIPQNQVKTTSRMQEVIDEVNFGGVGIFVDGLDVAYIADVKGWEHRSIGKPVTEFVIRGPQEGFNEILRMNTALLRNKMKDEDLIVEDIIVGKRSKTPCSILYVRDIANNTLINEVRERIKSIDIDHLTDSSELEQLIEDSSFLPNPQILATERPDRVASMLFEGRVAILVHGSPFALVMPVTFFDMIHSPEDMYVRFPYSTITRIIRLVGMLVCLLLPGIYIAITTFHQEMLPTELLLAIASSREKVPFPSLLGLFMLEFAFELIREAGIRIPGPIGPTLGIIGGLILGQAAVAANLVSPVLIIIVALTGIGSFAIPYFSLSYSFRFLKYLYILLGAAFGFFGIGIGIFINLLSSVSSKSFGVPYLSPIAPRSNLNDKDAIGRAPIWKQEFRPEFIKSKNVRKQPKVSRGWKIKSK